MSPALAKGLKIGAIITLVAIVIYVIYYFLKGSATGNKYGSAAAVAAGKSGSDGAFSFTQEGFDQLFNIGSPVHDQRYSSDIWKEDAFGQAWFKGMNIALTKANVLKYAADVNAYAAASFAKPHWEVTVGSFLK